MEEEKNRIKKKTSFLDLAATIVLGMLLSLIANLAASSQLMNSNILIAFGSLIVLVVITVVITTILKRGSSKVAILKDSLKEAYINAIDHSSLNPASRRRLER